MVGYADFVEWICEYGHVKLVPKGLKYDICNICGTKKAREVSLDDNRKRYEEKYLPGND